MWFCWTLEFHQIKSYNISAYIVEPASHHIYDDINAVSWDLYLFFSFTHSDDASLLTAHSRLDYKSTQVCADPAPPSFLLFLHISIHNKLLICCVPHHSPQMLQLFLAEVHHDFKWGPSVTPSHPVAFALAVPSGGVSEGVAAGSGNPASYWDYGWLTDGSQPCHIQSVRTTGTNLQCQLQTHLRHSMLQLKTV